MHSKEQFSIAISLPRVPKASNFISGGVQNRETKNRTLGMIVTSFQDFKLRKKKPDFSVILLLWANQFAKKWHNSEFFITKWESVGEICFSRSLKSWNDVTIVPSLLSLQLHSSMFVAFRSISSEASCCQGLANRSDQMLLGTTTHVRGCKWIKFPCDILLMKKLVHLILDSTRSTTRVELSLSPAWKFSRGQYKH